MRPCSSMLRPSISGYVNNNNNNDNNNNNNNKNNIYIYTPRLVIEHNTWQNKFYLFLRYLTRSYFPFLEMFNLSKTVTIR